LICYSLTYYPQIRAKTGLSPQTPKKWDFTMGPDYLSGRLYHFRYRSWYQSPAHI